MARPLRINRADIWYHVTARGIDRKTIFHQEAEWRHWRELLPELVHRFRLKLHAYVMMSNHYHLLVEAPEANLSSAMQWLQTSYSMWLNRKRGRVGPLFQGRFKAMLVEPPGWGLAVSRYVHLNPVRIKSLELDKQGRAADRLGVRGAPPKQLVQQRLKTLREYKWSSYRVYVNGERAPDWLTTEKVLELGGKGTSKERQEAYQRYVEEAAREGLEASPWEQLVGGLVLGSREFLSKAQKMVVGIGREQPHAKRIQARPEWEAVVAAVEKVRGVQWEELKSRRGDWGRDLAWYYGRRECGLRLGQLGELSGGIDYGTVSAGLQRINRRLSNDRSLARKAKQIEQQLR